MADTCYRCGGETLSTGALVSAVRTAFRPQDAKFLTLATGDVMTKATMCRNCGAIEIVGDVNKLRRLTSDPEPRAVIDPEPAVETLAASITVVDDE